MRIVRTGVTRTVVLVGWWAVKVPTIRGLGDPAQSGNRLASFARGILANKTEREWSSIDGVNPVVWSYRNLINGTGAPTRSRSTP